MIYVSESAKARISQIKSTEGYDDRYFVRVAVTSGGCSGLTYELDFDHELKKDAKQTFNAVISDVKNHGLFVELTDSMAFGMVHISTLDDDFYHATEDGTALVGRRKKKTYSLGQYISVQVERVDRYKRQIDFRVTAATNNNSAVGKSAKDLTKMRKERRTKYSKKFKRQD